MEQTVLAAMSGGVDSAAAAYLLKRAGWRCQGVYMCLYPPPAAGALPQDGRDAARIAAQLGIPFAALHAAGEFETQVIQKFVQVYEAGGTPNPCVDCNRCLKFGRLLQEAEARGLACVATGHYAQTAWDAASGRWLLKKAADTAKDQSYFLSMLNQSQLSRAQFPLGELEKRQVRALAEEAGLLCAQRRESQDICFVPDGDYAAFLERYTGRTYPPGDVLDLAGQAVGRHQGAVRCTLGQRKGLGLALGTPVYVCGKDMAANTVTVGPESALYRRILWAEGMNWIALEALTAPLRVWAKTRSRQREQPAVVYPEGPDRVRVEFDQPQRAVTPGQTLALYDGDCVVGGGTIVGTA